jgi:hypothetical protein
MNIEQMHEKRVKSLINYSVTGRMLPKSNGERPVFVKIPIPVFSVGTLKNDTLHRVSRIVALSYAGAFKNTSTISSRGFFMGQP